MSLSLHRTKADPRFGLILIAVFALGILGGSLAAFLNGGHVPVAHAAVLQVTKTALPL